MGKSWKWNYYELINCIRHCFREEFIQNYFKIFNFFKFLSSFINFGYEVEIPYRVDR